MKYFILNRFLFDLTLHNVIALISSIKIYHAIGFNIRNESKIRLLISNHKFTMREIFFEFFS